jgi:hypothetical protein
MKLEGAWPGRARRNQVLPALARAVPPSPAEHARFPVEGCPHSCNDLSAFEQLPPVYSSAPGDGARTFAHHAGDEPSTIGRLGIGQRDETSYVCA